MPARIETSGQKRSEPTVNVVMMTKRNPDVQAVRIRRQRTSGDRRVALQGRRVTITVDNVLWARGKMLNCLVTEMLQSVPTDKVYEVARWFDKRFEGYCRAPEAWTILRLVFSRSLITWLPCDRTSERVLPVLVDLLHEEKEPVE